MRAQRGGMAAPTELAAISFTFTLSLFERRLIRVTFGSISFEDKATTTGAMARIWVDQALRVAALGPVRVKSAFFSQNKRLNFACVRRKWL